MTSAERVAVVGAGIAGLTSAWEASKTARRVIVFDPAPSRAAATVAAGRLAPVTETEFGEPDMTNLCVEAGAQWPDFAASLQRYASTDDWFQTAGMLVVARDADDAAEITRLAEYQTKLGLDVDSLTSRELHRIEPALGRTIRRGLYVRSDQSVHNRILLQTLREACQQQGVEFKTERVTSASATHVETTFGTTEGDTVILAAGAWLNAINLPKDLTRVEIRPVKGQILRLQQTPSAVFPVHPLDGRDVYMVPRPNGELVVGASVEDKGFDTTTTAGAVHDLLRRARELVPGVDEMELTETSVGFRPATSNHKPVLGSLGANESGPFVIAGLYRNGILLAPTIAQAVKGWLQAQRTDPTLSPFSPRNLPTKAAESFL